MLCYAAHAIMAQLGSGLAAIVIAVLGVASKESPPLPD